MDKDIWFDGDGYTIGGGGIWATDRKGDPYLAHHFPAVPIELVKAKDEQGRPCGFVRVRFMTHAGDLLEEVVDVSELNKWGGRDHPMTRAGWPEPIGRKAEAVRSALLSALRFGGVPTREGFTLCGWIDGEFVRPGTNLYAGSLPPSIRQAGTEAGHFSVLREMAAESPLFALSLAVAFGSYLRGVVPTSANLSHIVEIHGEARTGKTTILEALASLETSPRKGGGCLLDSASTNVGLEFNLAAHNNGFLCVDELDDVLKHNGGAARLMYLTNGGGRLKGDGMGGLDSGKTWNACVFSSGNAKLSNLFKADDKAGALQTRCVELDTADEELHTFADRSKVARWIPELETNHGHGMTKAIATIKDKPDYWRSAYREAFDELISSHEWRHFDEERRFAEFMALSTVGAQLVAEVIDGATGKAANRAVILLKNRYKRGDEDEASAADVEAAGRLDRLRQFIANSAARWRWDGYAWHEDNKYQADKARLLSDEAAKYGAFGVVKQKRYLEYPEDIEGTIFISPQGEEALKRNGGLSIHELSQAAERFGLLNRGSGNHIKTKLGKGMAGILGASRVLSIELRELTDDDLPARKVQSEQEAGSLPIVGAFFGKHFAPDYPINSFELEFLPSIQDDHGEASTEAADSISEDDIPY